MPDLTSVLIGELRRQRVNLQDCGGGEWIVDGVINVPALLRVLQLPAAPYDEVKKLAAPMFDRFLDVLANPPEPNDKLKDMMRDATSYYQFPSMPADGWIPWNGDGRCPVDLDSNVEIKLFNGVRMKTRAGTLRWCHIASPDDITAYRVVPDDR